MMKTDYIENSATFNAVEIPYLPVGDVFVVGGIVDCAKWFVWWFPRRMGAEEMFGCSTA